MDVLTEKSTRIGFGYATHLDPFQCGREAAQSAKLQLPEGPVHLVLIFGPPTNSLNDFIEGVRLVLGDECLVAIPTDRTFSNETPLSNTCFIVAFHSPETQISIATDEISPSEILKGTTSLASQFRRHHTTNQLKKTHRGCLVFSHNLSDKNNEVAPMLGADMGLESWMVGTATATNKRTSLIGKYKNIQQGLLGIEFISPFPWGVGSVAIDSFRNEPNVFLEAIQTTLRDANAQMKESPPCFGLIIFDLSAEAEKKFPADILSHNVNLLSHIPLLAISGTRLFSRRHHRSVPQPNNSVLALLVPS